jgi:hypothetical protein
MPATAAIDNETLDHLLSMTDLALAALGRSVIAMFSSIVRTTAAGRCPAGARGGTFTALRESPLGTI